jgi:signal transduction histidine kinase
MLLELLKTPDKAQELSKRVLSSARGALNLIDEFLHARRLQEGTFVLQPTKNNVCALAESVVAEQRVVADARGIALDIKTSETHEGVVDGLAFSRAIQNLISNALKYTSKGGAVTVVVNVSNGATVVSVSDTGSGMEPAEVQRLFERFSRLAKHSHIQGSGLGLYLVKNIVSAHGGTVLVTSQPEKGSTFTLEFPANPPVNEKGQILCLDFA